MKRLLSFVISMIFVAPTMLFSLNAGFFYTTVGDCNANGL